MVDDILKIRVDDLKIGDIIYYDDRPQRVMQFTNPISGIRKIFLSISGIVVLQNPFVNLVKAVFNDFEVGDLVRVHPIPENEKQHYICMWYDELDHICDGNTIFEVKRILHTSHRGVVVTVNGKWFMPYHIEKVNQYDII